MPTVRISALGWIGAALALLLIAGGCTPGGQFDPTEALSNDIFGTKKRLVGEREPLFPNGVPGAETGVPPDLVKGYQPPPEPPPQTASAAPTPPPVPTASKPKPKPKPAVVHASIPPKTSSAPKPAPGGQAPWPAPQQSPAAQPNWPNPVQSSGPANWPPPQPPAPGQSVWPAQPGSGQAQQTAQPPPPAWPNPNAPGTFPR
jgi:hypothetical protein